MRHDNFTFNGINSLEYGVWFVEPATEITPERDVTRTTIPGRSGDLLDDNRRWLNTEIIYRVAILDNFQDNFRRLRQHLLAPAGYCRLEDSIHPDEYRLATVIDPIEPETYGFHEVGQFDIVFYCDPRRFLTAGEKPVQFSTPGKLSNPTLFWAAPLIEVRGNGSGAVTVGNHTVTINSMSDSLILDCERQNAYNDDGNQNRTIRVSEFPILLPGNNAVSWSGGVTGVTITPRWWQL